MAELVHLRLEHGLTELEEMERVGLFNRGEIRKIIKKRKTFEYRLRRQKKKKEDFLQYIEFETCLLELITKRRERLLCDSKKKEIDNSIAKKINRLFKAVISRFPEDKTLWLNQIDYLKRMKWNDSINALYSKLLQVHSRSPKLWVEAAKWEMKDHHSFDNARKILQRGVLLNPKSQLIWREYFRMELKYIDVIKKRKELLQLQSIEDEQENDAVLNGEIVNIVYDKGTEEIPDVEFALSFIQICLEHDFAFKNIKYILNDVQERFPDKEETLDALAKKPLLNLQKKIEKGMKKGLKKKAVVQKIYEKIFSKYNEAVSTLPTEKMWSFYLDFLFSLLHCTKASKKNKLEPSVIEKMKMAAEANCLSLEYYMHLIEMLFKNGEVEDALLISSTAAQQWNTVSLWTKCITLHIQCGKSKEEILSLFKEALSSVKEEDVTPLLKLEVDWLSICDPQKLMEVFEDGIKKFKGDCSFLKEMYLEATALQGGIQAARDLYKRFKKMGPLSSNLIEKIIRIEKGQYKPSKDLVRKYFEDGIREFGSDNTDIWLKYMQFQAEHLSDNPEMVSLIYSKAMKTLKPDLSKEFQARITNFFTENEISV